MHINILNNISNSQNDLKKEPLDLFILFTGALIFFHVVSNVIWIYLNNVPPTWDAALHTLLSIKYLNYISSTALQFNLIDFLKISDYYPPFVHLIGSFLSFIGNNNYKVIQLTGTIFFSLAIIFQYLYTKELFKNKLIAFFSSFFFSFFITVYQQSRDHMLDIPMTALLLGGLYFFEKSENFSKRVYVIFFSIFFSLAFLTKWYSVVYYAVPLCVSGLFIIFVKHKTTSVGKIKNILIGLIIFLFFCAPWYLTNLNQFLEISKTTAAGEQADPQHLLSIDNLLFNIKLIIMFQLSFTGFLFFLYSFFVSIKRISYRPVAIVVLTIVINYLLFSFISNKNIRYTIPLMPFFAIIMACGMQYCYHYYKRFVFPLVSYFFIFYYIATFVILSFGFPFKPEYKYSLQLPLINWVDVLYLHSYPVKVIFDTTTWPNKKILSDIVSSSSMKDKQNIRLLNLVDQEYINGYNLDPYLYSDLPSGSQRIELFFLPFLERYQNYAAMQQFLTTDIDYVLVPQKYIGLPEAIREYSNIQRFQQFLLENRADNYYLLNQYSISGNSLFQPDILLLYKKQAPS